MTEIETAKAFIRAQLAEGPMLRRDIEAAARDAGIADRTLRRARETMNVVVSKQNGAMTGPWLWALPEREFDGPSTKGRSRVWAVREAIASKNARREKPVPVPGDLGNQWTAS